MSTSVSYNGVTYTVPAVGDALWGTNVSNYLIALASGSLTKVGGNFTLTAADVNFGATYGLVSTYFKSYSSNIATTGVVRLANGDAVVWRNAANGADLALSLSTNTLQFNSIALADIASSQTLTNKTMSGASNTFTNLPSSAITGTLGPANGGTGVANNAANTLTFAGNYSLLLTLSAATSVTLPTSGTLATLAGSETLTNKTLTGNIAVNLVSGAATITLPTVTGTLATLAGTETLTNKTLSGNIATNFLSGGNTVTLPTTTDTLVGRATTDTLTNKTLTLPVIASISNGGTVTVPSGADTLVARTSTDTLTNKTLTSPTINGGTATALTGLAVRDTSAAFDVTLAATSSVALTTGRKLTIDMGNSALTVKAVPLSNFSTLADGSAGQVLTTLGTNSGYAWAAGLTTTLNQYNVLIGNASNVATSTNTNLVGDVKSQTNSQTATVTIAAPGVFTATAHGMVLGDKFYLTTSGALPTGLSANTTYYASNIAANTFNASSTLANAIAGTYITTSGSQSGTHTLFNGGMTLTNSGNASSVTAQGKMQYLHGTTYNGGIAPTVAVTNLSTIRAVFVPYQMMDGGWRMRFNVMLTLSSGTTSFSSTVNGVTWQSAYPTGSQTLSAFAGSGDSQTYCLATSTNVIQASTGTSSTLWGYSGDVELASKPTWAY